jgi:hypothetical protein
MPVAPGMHQVIMSYIRSWHYMKSCTNPSTSALHRAAPAMYDYTSRNGGRFILNTIPASFAAGERFCNDQGGHLAAFVSADEQSEVEQYFLKLGTLYPTFNRMYWLGLRTNASAWPVFDWLDRVFPTPDELEYTHWGLGRSIQEPDNVGGQELCAGSDATLGYDGAWGWADYNCTALWPFICRLQGGWVVQGRAAALGVQAGAVLVRLGAVLLLLLWRALHRHCLLPRARAHSSVLAVQCRATCTWWPASPWPYMACQARPGHTAHVLCHPSATGPGEYYFTSPKTRIQYLLNTIADSQTGAEAACNAFGGHLVLYNSLSEQQDVERAFLFEGGLIGSFHRNYWVGMVVSEWPAFEWLDRTLPAPSNRTYVHWGKGQPNEQQAQCAVAQWNSSYSMAWGWGDNSNCDAPEVYICEKSREWMHQLPGCLAAVASYMWLF